MSAEDYIGACLQRIAAVEDKVHAFVHLDADAALRQARALDEHRRNGKPLGALHGVPVGIKDIFDAADYPTECGSPLFKGRRPMRDCTAVARLRAAGFGARPCRCVRSLADCALILDVLAGYDAEDHDSRPLASPAFRALAAEKPPAPPRSSRRFR